MLEPKQCCAVIAWQFCCQYTSPLVLSLNIHWTCSAKPCTVTIFQILWVSTPLLCCTLISLCWCSLEMQHLSLVSVGCSESVVQSYTNTATTGLVDKQICALLARAGCRMNLVFQEYGVTHHQYTHSPNNPHSQPCSGAALTQFLTPLASRWNTKFIGQAPGALEGVWSPKHSRRVHLFARLGEVLWIPMGTIISQLQ